MTSKILLLALSVAVFSSCSTAYKTGQTPDDVYYSPVKPVQERTETRREEVSYERTNSDYEIAMSIRDPRWRNFRYDYDYDYSPYNYCYSNVAYKGYYYNPYYYPWAIYTANLTYRAAVNSTPRMVNLNAYNGYNTKVATSKTNGNLNVSGNTTQYNNSNRSGSRIGNILRQTIEPTPNSSSSSNNSRTYSPSSSSSSSSSGSSSSGSSSSSSRPARGG
jgi:uncharacterized membrane protein YgcG